MCATIIHFRSFSKITHFDGMLDFSPKTSKRQILHGQIWKRKKPEELTAVFILLIVKVYTEE